MKEVSRFLMALFAASLLSGCSEETNRKGEEPLPGENSNKERREVQLILNNELALKKTETRAPGDVPIATTEENAISSLDVYVFGCATENGDYTLQERFAYRADEDAVLPEDATLLELAATDATKKESQGLLKLKKGLFVKLYCIANNETLINPAIKQIVKEDDFVPLTFTTPGEAGTGVAIEGTPRESEFLTFHTPLLEADQTKDILLTPLAMAGSYTIPVDLTDFETSARMQVGFKLTRLAARFDIVNKSDESRFTITEVSMGNGRRGTTFFPIRIYGQTPTAQPDELITLPTRNFDGTDANKGTQTGAFYSYPSPIGDGGFLILKGKYQVNATEEKEVSYQIPFTQNTDDGSTISLDINNNHRYTIGITKADDYHLDFTLSVADWTDSGKVDDYTPGGNGKADIKVEIPLAYQGKTDYIEDTRTVTMFIKEEASNFDLIVSGTSPLVLQRSYAGGLSAKEYDWLAVTDNSVAGLTEYTYNLSPVKGYTKKRYPKAIFRFMNLTDGTESVVFVNAQTAPALDRTTQPQGSFNTFNEIDAKAAMYKTPGSLVKMQLSCQDGVSLKEKPDWLDVTTPEVSGIESTYTFTLNNSNTTDTNGKITFENTKQNEWITSVDVELKDASISSIFSSTMGGNSYSTVDNKVTMNLIDKSAFKFATTSPAGVSVESITYVNKGDPDWLSHVQTKAVSETNEYSFGVKNEALSSGKKATTATVTLKNKVGGDNIVFTVEPEYQNPILSTASSVTLSATKDVNQIPQTTISGTCLGGCFLEGEDWIIYDKTSVDTEAYAYKLSLNPSTTNFPTTLPGTKTITIKNNQDPTKTTTVGVSFAEVDAWIIASPTSSQYAESTSDGYRINTSGGTMTVSLYTMFAIPTLSASYDGTYCNNSNNGTSWLTFTQTKSEQVGNRKKYTFTIKVTNSTGTDATYQLHKADALIKQGGTGTQIQKYTVWRGASYYGYPAGTGSPYYTAIKRGSYWWAPINCGATKVAENGTTDTNGIGGIYQWGRKDACNHGSPVASGPISNSTPKTIIFMELVRHFTIG